MYTKTISSIILQVSKKKITFFYDICYKAKAFFMVAKKKKKILSEYVATILIPSIFKM